MKKLNFIMGSLLSVFMLNACDNEIPEQESSLNDSGREYSFTVNDYRWEDEMGSRTQIGLDLSFSWADGDTIGIMPDEGSQVYFAINPEDAGKNQATFSGGAWALKPGNDYAAYYPFVQDIMLDRTKVPVKYHGQVAAGQTMNNLGDYDYMAARPTGTNASGGLNFAFDHLGVPVRLTFSVPVPSKVNQIILTSPRPVFPLTGYIDLTQDELAIAWGKEDLSPTFCIDVEDVVTTLKNQSVEVYFMMPLVDLSGESDLAMTVLLEEGDNLTYSLEGKQLNAGYGSIWNAGKYQSSWGDYTELYNGFGQFIQDRLEELGGTKLKFVSNSTVTSDMNVYWTTAPIYTVRNGEWLEFHTPAKKFMAYDWALQFSGFDCFRYAMLTEIDLSDVDFSQLQYMGGMFNRCASLEKVTFAKDVNTANVTDISFMFADCSSLTSLDLSHFDTSNVKDMQCVFGGCTSLVSLDLNGFNTENVTSMASMFSGCSSLTSLDLSNFNTENVTSMVNMFYVCSSLTSLDLGSFNTGNVADMNSMFNGCSSLTSLDLSGFDTGNVLYMYNMFSGCSSLTSLDLSSFNTGNVMSMNSMFSGCSSLASLDLSSFNTENVFFMSYMFSNCCSLTSLDLSSFSFNNLYEALYMFYATGAWCPERPISIIVSEEGKTYLESWSTGIDPEYAEWVVKTN